VTHIDIGTPTQYGFRLPQLRYELSRPYLPDGASSRLLDFGCGNGANTVLFAGDVASIDGVDVEEARVSEATRAAADLGLTNISYRVYDGDSLPFEDAAFDHVTSYEVLEHTTDDAAAVAEIRRVLRPGAAITISVPNKWYLMETHGFDLRPRWVKWNRVPFMSWLPTSVHERYACARIYTKRRIVDLLEQGGFEVLAHEYIMPPFDKVERPSLKRSLEGTFSAIERSPLRVVGVAHFLAARRR
jgi:ubiquinone/menaquinone biosynthesis C-methylase UbiE